MEGAKGTKNATPPSNQGIYSKDGSRKLDFTATLLKANVRKVNTDEKWSMSPPS